MFEEMIANPDLIVPVLGGIALFLMVLVIFKDAVSARGLQELVMVSAVIAWIGGAVLAKGFWSTFFCIIPFWSWYLVIEKIMIAWGLA